MVRNKELFHKSTGKKKLRVQVEKDDKARKHAVLYQNHRIT